MKLLTKALLAKLPKLYATEKLELKDKVAVIKFFAPWTNWTWYAVEGQEEDGTMVFFGYVKGHEDEWGNFTLAELESVRGPFGLKIERDLHWKPQVLKELQ